MKDRGLELGRLQRPIAANAQHDLLLQTHFQISPIQLVGDLPIFRRIFRKIGVQQKQSQPAHIDRPHLSGNRAVRQFDLHANLGHRVDRQSMKVVVLVRLLLPARSIEILAKVALLIQQSHSHQRQSQIARCFQMIPRQYAQPSREN